MASEAENALVPPGYTPPRDYPSIDLNVVARMPTFAAAEAVFLAVALCALVHAVTRPSGHPNGRQRHVLLFVFAIVGGSMSDLFFMHLPIVDNFWHAQGTLMLTERLPFYILCVYPGFLYVPLACVWRLGLPALAETTLTGILTVAFYAPFDVVGAKFLWWTWHDSDTVTMSRVFGVPASSTMWVCVYSSMFALMFRLFLPVASSGERPPLLWKPWKIGVFLRALVGATLAIPVMMLVMTLIQCVIGWSLPPPPAPNRMMLGITLMIYGSLTLSSIADGLSPGEDGNGTGDEHKKRSRIAEVGSKGSMSYLIVALVLYYGALVYIAYFSDPTDHVSTGRHQTFGPCNVEVSDYAGDTRHQYICRETRFNDFAFDGCGDGVNGGDMVEAVIDQMMPWYTICGVKKTHLWVRSSLVYSLTGAATFALVIWAGNRQGATNNGKSD